MKAIVLRLCIGVIALWVTSFLAQQLGLELRIGSASGAILAVLALSLVNSLVRPVLAMLTAPLNCLTFGLVGVLLNALLFLAVGQMSIPGFKVEGFLAALFGSVVMGVVSALLNTSTRVAGLR